MKKKTTKFTKIFLVTFLFCILSANTFTNVFADDWKSKKGQDVLDSGAYNLKYYYGDGKNYYVQYKWNRTSNYQGLQEYFTLSKEDLESKTLNNIYLVDSNFIFEVELNRIIKINQLYLNKEMEGRYA